MDWRLIAALGSFTGSLCLVGVVAVPFFAEPPAAPKKPPPTPAFPARSAPGGHAVAAPPTPALAYAALQSPVLEQRIVADAAESLTSTVPASTDLSSRPASRIAHSVGPNLGSVDLPRLDAPAADKSLQAGPRVAPAQPRYQGVLTEAEIARIRNSLRLTPEQALLWPPVHSALSEMGRQQMAQIKNGQKPQILAEDWPPQRLYSVAGPLIKSLRPDQKDQVRALCRSLGFQMVASLI
jgi:hypothetical protein